jgi:uncharacterized protein (UPF0332 family)/predicted nucleotidyltransferase
VIDIQNTKQKALDDFTARLLQSSMKDYIARIILFGSVLDGEDQPESDVDVLVFGTARLRELSEACAAASFETAMRWGENVEPLVYCSDDMRFPQSYFLYDTLRRGKEIYRMDEEVLRRQEAGAALNLAREYLTSAEDASAHGHYRLAVDGAYNSAELAVKGLLYLEKLEKMPSSHGGTVQMFGRHYVMTGLVAPEQSHRLNVHLELRNKARYDFHIRITQDDARDTLSLAREFIAFLEAQLREREPSES